jgi:hypothetical protein
MQDESSQIPASAQMQAQTSPKGGPAGTSGQEYLKPAEYAKSVKKGTLIIAFIFLAGGAGIWLMIKKVGPSAAAAAQSENVQKIDEVLSQFSTFRTQVSSEMDKVAMRLNQSSQIGQVGVDELKKNPFRQQLSLDNSPQDASAVQLQQRKEEMRRRGMAFQLWSITENTENPCCMINDKVLFVGDMISGFTVKKIAAGEVFLEYEDITVELKMPQ